VRVDLDNTWRGTDYAWELYRYDVPWEDRNVFAEDHVRPWARQLMRRLRTWDDCAPAQCRAATRENVAQADWPDSLLRVARSAVRRMISV
jgi:hypothetical protein